MKPYIAIVHKDPGSAYGVTFPDAPGCFSAADSIDELFTNAAEAIALWTDSMNEEGRTIPLSCDLPESKLDPEWAESFADAALVIAVSAPASATRAVA